MLNCCEGRFKSKKNILSHFKCEIIASSILKQSTKSFSISNSMLDFNDNQFS